MIQITTASDALTAAIHALLVAQMAATLWARCADPRCDASVVHALTLAGFGLPTICALRTAAADAAARTQVRH